MTQKSPNTVPQLQQCPFCLQPVGIGQCVCLACGAQHRTEEVEGPILGYFAAMILMLGICAVSVPLAMYGMGLVIYIPHLIGLPDFIVIIMGVVSFLWIVVKLPWMSWKALNGLLKKTSTYYLVWSRGGHRISTPLQKR